MIVTITTEDGKFACDLESALEAARLVATVEAAWIRAEGDAYDESEILALVKDYLNGDRDLDQTVAAIDADVPATEDKGPSAGAVAVDLAVALKAAEAQRAR